MKPLISVIGLTAALLVGPANAALSTFALGTCSQLSANANIYGNAYSCSPQGTATSLLNVSAYAAVSGSGFAAAHVASGTGGFGVLSTIEGLNAPALQRAMDNDGQLELLLFRFDKSIALQRFELGLVSGDSDLSILAYTGTDDAVSALTSAREDTLLNGNWNLVGHFADSGNSLVSFNGGPGAISSRHWIVSSFSRLGQSTPTWTATNDYVELKMVAGTFTCQNSSDPGCITSGGSVPVPSTFVLAGAALLCLWGARRRLVAHR